MLNQKTTLMRLNQNLNILREREAKYAGNTPLDLLNQIHDHNIAITLTKQALAGELSQIEWQEALNPLMLAIRDGQVVNLGDKVKGDKVAVDKVLGNKSIFQGDVYIYESLPSKPTPAEANERRALEILLGKVKQFWIEGVLEKTLHQMALIDLGKETQADAVSHSWEHILELPQQSPQIIPPDKKISQTFDEMNRALLILGEPGSGKTITLLQLARELIWQVETDQTFSQPIPVVFNLSTWAEHQPLLEWLVEELATKYQIPKRIGRPWLEGYRILPLLDGLDEVQADRQAACVEAINKFAEEYGLAGLVVCSRLKDYTGLPVRLKLNGAIRLQPLTLEQVNNYLAAAGSKLDALRQILRDDTGLQELAQSPLTLSIMSLAYQDLSVESLVNQALDTIEARRAHLFNTYIARMFGRKGQGNKPFTDGQTIGWLSWLAQQMSQNNQTVFLIEQMQPNWVSSPSWRRLYILSSRLIIGLIIGLIVGLSFILSFGFIIGENEMLNFVPRLELNYLFSVGVIRFSDRLIIGLTFGLVGGLILGFFDIFRLERRSVMALRNSAIPGLLIINTTIILAVIVFCFILSFGITDEAYGVLVVALSFGLCFGPLIILRGGKQSIASDIQTVETLSWSWSGAVKGGFVGLILGSIFYIIIYLIRSLSLAALNVSAILILAGAIFWGMESGVIELKTIPNQGIRSSFRNAIYMGIIFGLVVGIVSGVIVVIYVWLWFYPNTGLRLAIISGSIFGLTLGSLTTLWYGGLDIIEHYTLRFILYVQSYTPLNYVRLLDYTAHCIFLQKVGGGYIFIHRLLMEHFASLEYQALPLKRNKTVLKWITGSLVLAVLCGIVVVYFANTLPQARDAIYFATLAQQGLEFVKQGKAEEAFAILEKAQSFRRSSGLEIPGNLWDRLCWVGSVWGHAAEVMDACERAVTLAPNDGGVRDSRGLARTLTGDYKGAVEDFKFLVDWLKEHNRYIEGGYGREAWITKLEAGQNPFDEATLKEFRGE